MKLAINLFTMFPWILYVIEIYYYRIGVIETGRYNKDKYFKHLNKNLFSSINIKELVLFFIFILFMLYKKTLVLKILFTFFYLYLLLDFFLTLAKDCKKIKHKSLMVQVVIMCSLIILSYIIFRKLYLTYILMFITSILSSFIIYIFSVNIKLFKSTN